MKIAKIREVKTPQRGKGSEYDRSGGIDFYIPNFTDKFKEDFKEKNPHIFISSHGITVNPQERVLIPSGIKVNLESVKGFNTSQHNGIIMKCENKSGVSTKTGLVIGANVIDEDYQGELHIHVINTSNKTITLQEEYKIAQMLLIPIFIDNEIEVVDEDELFDKKSIRGTGGFGSTNKSKIKLIAAVDKNWGLGFENQLLIDCKEEMKHFVETTTGCNILMGHNTFKSIGSKGLKNRFTYVLTNNPNGQVEKDVKFINSSELSKLLHSREFKLQGKDLFVCGGAEIYGLFLLSNNYDEAIISHFDTEAEVKADCFLDISMIKANSSHTETETMSNFTIIKYLKDEN